MSWRSGQVDETRVQYKAGTTHQINASIGLWFGLRGVNVTLTGKQQFGNIICDACYFTDNTFSGRNQSSDRGCDNPSQADDFNIYWLIFPTTSYTADSHPKICLFFA